MLVWYFFLGLLYRFSFALLGWGWGLFLLGRIFFWNHTVFSVLGLLASRVVSVGIFFCGLNCFWLMWMAVCMSISVDSHDLFDHEKGQDSGEHTKPDGQVVNMACEFRNFILRDILSVTLKLFLSPSSPSPWLWPWLCECPWPSVEPPWWEWPSWAMMACGMRCKNASPSRPPEAKLKFESEQLEYNADYTPWYVKIGTGIYYWFVARLADQFWSGFLRRKPLSFLYKDSFL